MVLCDADETGADVDIIGNAITSLSFLNFLPSRKVSDPPLQNPSVTGQVPLFQTGNPDAGNSLLPLEMFQGLTF